MNFCTLCQWGVLLPLIQWNKKTQKCKTLACLNVGQKGNPSHLSKNDKNLISRKKNEFPEFPEFPDFSE